MEFFLISLRFSSSGLSIWGGDEVNTSLIRDSPSASITRRQRRGALPPRTRARYCHCCPPTRHRRRSSSTGLPDGRHSGRTRPWAGTRPAIRSLAAASRKPRPRGSSTASASTTAAASGGGRVHRCSLGVPEDVSVGASAGWHKTCHNDGSVGSGTTPAAMTSSEGASSRHRAFYMIAPASPNPEFDDVNGVQSLSAFKKPRPVIPA
ncbi:unnamed protein product [Musa acuminata subsp. burmannicoides]